MLPAGAEAAVLFGDPTKAGLFALRLKVPSGYAIPPHTHPADEVVTVISGTTNLGMGETADRSAAKALPAGSFFALPPGTAHFVYFDEETVVQITTNGPWGLKYVNPADDPQIASRGLEGQLPRRPGGGACQQLSGGQEKRCHQEPAEGCSAAPLCFRRATRQD